MSDYNALYYWDHPYRQAPMPTEGDNYGYASSMPHYTPDTREYAALMKGLRGLSFGLMAGGSALEPSMLMKALSVPFAAAAIDDFGEAANDSLHRRGIGRMDRDLNAMRYYGHDNMRGPR